MPDRAAEVKIILLVALAPRQFLRGRARAKSAGGACAASGLLGGQTGSAIDLTSGTDRELPHTSLLLTGVKPAFSGREDAVEQRLTSARSTHG